LRHAQEPTYSFVILTLVLIVINTALAWLSVKFIPAGNSGIALVYIAVAFMILFTLWFGAYGGIAAYVGTLLAGVLSTESLLQHPEIAVIWAVAGSCRCSSRSLPSGYSGSTSRSKTGGTGRSSSSSQS
jgi:hypothetical protein